MAATLAELNVAMADSVKIEETRSAVVVAAKNVVFEAVETDNHANRLILANKILKDPNTYGQPFWRFVVAVLATKELGTVGVEADTILGASKTVISDNVSLGFNVFANGS